MAPGADELKFLLDSKPVGGSKRFNSLLLVISFSVFNAPFD